MRRIMGWRWAFNEWVRLRMRYLKLSSMLITKNSELAGVSSPMMESYTPKMEFGSASNIVFISLRLCCFMLKRISYDWKEISSTKSDIISLILPEPLSRSRCRKQYFIISFFFSKDRE